MTSVLNETACALCGADAEPGSLATAAWLSPGAVFRLALRHPEWRRGDGACPACVQQALLETLVQAGHEALHEGIQAVWPLDSEAAFGAIPTPLRLHADPRYTGRGIGVAFVDAGFYPHPDLIRPANRIRAWAAADGPRVRALRFGPRDQPGWPGWDAGDPRQWHGLMTSVTAAGNGTLSHSLYRGLACDSHVALVHVSDAAGRIGNESIARALRWIGESAEDLGIRLVSLSVAGDPVSPLAGNPVDEAVAALAAGGILVVAAAGNDGQRRLVPPATAPEALTVGGLDDKNVFDHGERELWHSSYGETAGHAPKPEVVAPSLWVAAPVLPGTALAREAAALFAGRLGADSGTPEALGIEARLRELKLVTPHYQHVEGTSFAAPLVAGIAACMLEANPGLTPRRLRELLTAAAQPVAGASPERQGSGAVDAGRAVTLALADRHTERAEYAASPVVQGGEVRFLLHEHQASHVEVFGVWNGWRGPGLAATEVEPGLWEARLEGLPAGEYAYKFLLDGTRWLVDSANPLRAADDAGNWNSLLRIPWHL